MPGIRVRIILWLVHNDLKFWNVLCGRRVILFKMILILVIISCAFRVVCLLPLLLLFLFLLYDDYCLWSSFYHLGLWRPGSWLDWFALYYLRCDVLFVV